jgi:hypothetical protein
MRVELPTAIIIPMAKVRLISGIVIFTPASPKGPTYLPINIPSTIVYIVKTHIDTTEGIVYLRIVFKMFLSCFIKNHSNIIYSVYIVNLRIVQESRKIWYNIARGVL